ncbi:hypothetical protein IQ266_06220 [filamentous cyanobacterium LEGE 11480]|uniref:Uncharacterized protein n=1 Tax=Romeriopsis navalis LEGE 11480 TaxID=2777977 RepID=A0A928Z2S5_9CYAN|nr:hypothetical protein [Romeriopsis navalis]MBE9029357.1 hypothetical protein [Romeriopsis navalis LEGE 11480]
MLNSLKARSFVSLCSAFVLSLLIWFGSLAIAPAADALTPVKLTDVTYETCPPEIAKGTVTTRNSQPAKCFIVSAMARNDSSKYLYDADVFGRIYDANGDTVFENRGRIGTVAEIPPGESQIQVRITVDPSQPEPLSLKQFKATGFAQQIRREQIIPSDAE